jgi:hypothetical protein
LSDNDFEVTARGYDVSRAHLETTGDAKYRADAIRVLRHDLYND